MNEVEAGYCFDEVIESEKKIDPWQKVSISLAAIYLLASVSMTSGESDVKAASPEKILPKPPIGMKNPFPKFSYPNYYSNEIESAEAIQFESFSGSSTLKIDLDSIDLESYQLESAKTSIVYMLNIYEKYLQYLDIAKKDGRGVDAFDIGIGNPISVHRLDLLSTRFLVDQGNENLYTYPHNTENISRDNMELLHKEEGQRIYSVHLVPGMELVLAEDFIENVDSLSGFLIQVRKVVEASANDVDLSSFEQEMSYVVEVASNLSEIERQVDLIREQESVPNYYKPAFPLFDA